ncbi:Putative phosphatase YieH [Labilithrix luteola]|uniref:Putative phosphatase YieH n=1 Tax=Labilithrix luteola TaxID=1391654 RepID=A0A0K1PKC2_9BACT|nr:HAD-IA family hydrolase [Labilithrix luteola]AKU93967.1 Putative phosphatase YieH [Labilithrix luteola]
MSIEAVLFDCDGTLVDSEHLTNQVLVEYLAELGHTMSVLDALDAYVGLKMADCVADLERRFRTTLPPGFVEVFRARTALAFTERLRPIDGADAMLSSLSLPFYVASSGPRQKIEHSLTVTGLLRHFPNANVFTAYEIGHWKPDPAFYRAVLSKLGLRPHQAVVVEDSVAGIRSALGAGLRTIALGPAERLSGDLASALAVPDLARATEALRRLHESPS